MKTLFKTFLLLGVLQIFAVLIYFMLYGFGLVDISGDRGFVLGISSLVLFFISGIFSTEADKQENN